MTECEKKQTVAGYVSVSRILFKNNSYGNMQ